MPSSSLLGPGTIQGGQQTLQPFDPNSTPSDYYLDPAGDPYMDPGLQGYSPYGTIDPEFQAQIMLLLRAQMNVSALDPAQVQGLVQATWNDPGLQSWWNDNGPGGLDPYLNDTYKLDTAFRSVVTPILFTPGGSLAQQGIQAIVDSGQSNRLTSAQQAFFQGSNAKVQLPFDSQFFPNVTESHAQGDPGIDYGMPSGQQINTPFDGTVSLIDTGTTNGGKMAKVTLASGMTFYVAHLENFAGLQDGQTVHAGDIIGYSGGGPTMSNGQPNPSPGDSTGPHVEIGFIDASGKYIDPTATMSLIYSGTTYAALAPSLGKDLAVNGVVAGTSSLYSRLKTQWAGLVSQFKKYYAREPTLPELQGMIASNPNDAQVAQQLRAMPSHIAGMNNGQYDDASTALNGAMQQVFGHQSTDAMVKEFFDRGAGLGGQAAQDWVTSWDIHNNLDPKLYNQIWQASKPTLESIYNQPGFDPRIAMKLATDHNLQPPTPTQASQTAEKSPIPGVPALQP